MKTKLLSPLACSVFGLTGFCASGRAEVMLPPTHATISIGITGPGPATATTGWMAVAPDNNLHPVRWDDIRDLDYSRRPDFFTGLQHLVEKLDEQFNELSAQQAATQSSVDKMNRAFALKQFELSRFYLHRAKETLRTAGPEGWNQQKNTVGEAWLKSQEAYAKAKSTMMIPNRAIARKSGQID